MCLTHQQKQPTRNELRLQNHRQHMGRIGPSQGP